MLTWQSVETLTADVATRRGLWWLVLRVTILGWCCDSSNGDWSVDSVPPWVETKFPYITTSFRGGRTVAECVWRGSAPRINGTWWQIEGSTRTEIAKFNGSWFQWITLLRDGGAFAWESETSKESQRRWQKASPVSIGEDSPGDGRPDSSSRPPRSPSGSRRGAGSRRNGGNPQKQKTQTPKPPMKTKEYWVHSWIELTENFAGSLACAVFNSSSEVSVEPAPSLSWEEASPESWAVRCQPPRGDPRLLSNRSAPYGLAWWLNGSVAATVSYPPESSGPQTLSIYRTAMETLGPGSSSFSYEHHPPRETTGSGNSRTTTVPQTRRPSPDLRPWFEIETVSNRMVLQDQAWAAGTLCVSCTVIQPRLLGVATTACRSHPPSRRLPVVSKRSTPNGCAWSATAAAGAGVLFGAVATAGLTLTLGPRARRGSVRFRNSRH
ncbi:m167 [Muromegalovirus WP15B]|uniref:M167 n=1 Tax=Muromegalovirus WP15B TaxID=524651 RepID=B3UXC5_MUHV1|nr:m167 [Muromegalovirus WP15B]